ncbi:hypothetical protein ST37_10005 [Vibrio sp. qd031]|nr:hypothetical protein ST37_10005 [Vibrio sp. qd031]
MRIDQIQNLPIEINCLVAESKSEGFKFLERFVSEFANGTNRFDLPGEALFAVYIGGKLVGIGGVNQELHSNSYGIGRVRRLYISKNVRGVGIGKALMQEIECHAQKHFEELQLFTDSSKAADFYCALDYEPACQIKVSHRKRLNP